MSKADGEPETAVVHPGADAAVSGEGEEQLECKPTFGNLSCSNEVTCSLSIVERHEDISKSSSVKRENEGLTYCEWLPSGWSFEIKTRKRGLLAGRTYKCYIEESSGCRFYSKRDVFRYLNAQWISNPAFNHGQSILLDMTPNSLGSSNQKGVVANSQSKAEVLFDYSPRGLPHGWVKEIRISTSRGRIRRDPYYIDPISGCKFRSRNEVTHYLEKGKRVPRAAKTKNSCTGMHLSEKETNVIATVEPKSQRKSARRCLFLSEESLFEVKVMMADSVADMFYMCYPERTPENASKQCGQDDKSCLTYPECAPENSSTTCISGAGSSCLTPDFALSDEANLKKVQFERCHVAVSIEDEDPGKTSGDTLVPPNKSSDSDDINGDQSWTPGCETKSRKRRKQIANRAGKHSGRRSSTRDSKVITNKLITAPLRASKRLAVIEADTVVTNRIDNPSLRVPTKGSVDQEVIKGADLDVARHSASEERIGQYEGVLNEDLKLLESLGNKKQPEEMAGAENLANGPSSSSPESPFIKGVWSDPCLEFAFKTLTGDIPLDGVAIGAYLQNP